MGGRATFLGRVDNHSFQTPPPPIAELLVMLQRGQYRPEEVTLELIMTMLWILDSWCVGGQGHPCARWQKDGTLGDMMPS